MRLLLSVGLGCAIALSVIGPTAVRAAQSEGSPDVIYAFDIKPQPLGAALNAFALQVSHQILFTPELVTGKTTQGVKGHYTADGALTRVLAGSGLVFSRSAGGMILVSRADGKNGVPTSDAQIGTSSEPTESSRSNSSASEGLEEITVTAQRRVENLNKVPISLTALPQSLMDDLHIQNIADLTSIVPGLEIPPANGMANANMDIGIRGIFSGGNAPTTQIYIDETPIAIRELSAGPSGSFYPDIFDLDRVEVLRGPQGTLFGSSAMGGAIRFITPQPNLTQDSGYAKAEVADTEHGEPSYAVGVAYGAPVIEGTAGFRVSSWFRSDGGYIDAVDPVTGEVTRRNTNSSNTFADRAAFTLVPADGWTITPALFLQQQHTDDLAAYWQLPDLGRYRSGDAASQPSTDSITLPSLAVRYEFRGMALQSDTSFLDRWYNNRDDITQVIQEFFAGQVMTPGLAPSFRIPADQIGGTRAWQQEFRLTSSNDSRFKWVVGAYFRRAEERLAQTIAPDLSPLTEAIAGVTSAQFFGGVPDYVFNGQALSSLTDYRTIDEETSFFSDASFDITDRFKISAGVRIEHSVVEDQSEIVAGPLNGVAFSQLVLPDQVQNPVTPRLAVTYQYTDQDMVYASASKGYRAGGGNSANVFENALCDKSLAELGYTSAPQTFTSDRLWSYEVGAKDSLLEGHLSTQASVFYIDWSNIQTGVSLPSCAQTFTTNRGRATIQGFELQFEAIPFSGLKIGGNISYTDAYYPNAEYGAPVNGAAPLLVAAGDKLGAGIGEVSGAPLPVIPWTAALHAEYSWSIGSFWSGARSYLRADYRWQDGDPAGDPRVAAYDPFQNAFRNSAYSTLNLRLGAVHSGLDLSAFVNNLTNSHPNLAYDDLGIPGSQLAYQSAIRPLTAGITALFKF